jgi:hypothetical protein
MYHQIESAFRSGMVDWGQSGHEHTITVSEDPPMWTAEQDYFDRQEEMESDEVRGFGDGLDGVPPESGSASYLAGWQEVRESGLQHNRVIPFNAWRTRYRRMVGSDFGTLVVFTTSRGPNRCASLQ